MITNRLNKLSSLPKKEQDEIIKEIDGLVYYLIEGIKKINKNWMIFEQSLIKIIN
ncbi:MAG TPA: hypothetical protein VIM70_10910 [Clostridium sp.]|uniref:hypothetical protein n=1 Tax=Clostridium sp. TaxID=1506 RepID=UPI002F935F97